MTLSEKVQFIFLGQDFDFHTATHALPGTFQQIGFQFSQAALGSSNQVINRRNACAHLGQHFLGGHATIMPHAGLRRIERHSLSERACVNAA